MINGFVYKKFISQYIENWGRNLPLAIGNWEKHFLSYFKLI